MELGVEYMQLQLRTKVWNRDIKREKPLAWIGGKDRRSTKVTVVVYI